MKLVDEFKFNYSKIGGKYHTYRVQYSLTHFLSFLLVHPNEKRNIQFFLEEFRLQQFNFICLIRKDVKGKSPKIVARIIELLKVVKSFEIT